jgi:predicted DNA-binding transcriptional regulator YafY
VHEAICNALLNNSQIKITYRATAREHAMTYAVSPLGMVIKGGISYLIAAHADKPDPLKLSMHRIQVADLLYDEATAPASWVGLDAYIKAGYLLFPPGDVNKDQEVTLRFDLVFARNIEEMPIGDGQTVKKETARAKGEASYCLVKARVTISEEFVRWILQYGSHVEVVSPASLRKRVQGIILELQSKYKI